MLTAITSTSCSISIRFSFLFLINTYVSRKQHVMPPKYTRTGGSGGRVIEAEGALIVTNPDPAELSGRPIKPESRHISGPLSSNDDVLVNDSRDDTDVSSMIEPLEKKDKRS